MNGDLGGAFARAVAAKDTQELRRILAPVVDFRGLTPRSNWEADDVEALLAVLFDHWFETHDVIDDVLEVEPGEPVEDISSVTYRFAITTPTGPHIAEQRAYYRSTEDRIDYLRIMCSGFRPRS